MTAVLLAIRWLLAAAVVAATLVVAPIGTASGAPAPKTKTKNFLTVVGPQKFGKEGDTLREEVDCPSGWFAINGGYLTSGIVVSTLENFALRHPQGWVAVVHAPPPPPPFAPQEDVSISVKVDCAKSGVPVVLPVGTASRAPTGKPKGKTFITVFGDLKQGKSGDKLHEEVDCPKGYFALNGGYAASGILISTWENFPVRHPDGWVAEVFAPPNGPYGPAQDISLKVKVDCAKSGIPLVLPVGTTSRAPTQKPKAKSFMTLYGTQQSGKAGEKLHTEVDCPKGWFAINGGALTSGTVFSTWESFAVRHPDGWVAEVYAPPAGPFAPPQDVTLQAKVDCAKSGIPVVLPSG